MKVEFYKKDIYWLIGFLFGISEMFSKSAILRVFVFVFYCGITMWVLGKTRHQLKRN